MSQHRQFYPRDPIRGVTVFKACSPPLSNIDHHRHHIMHEQRTISVHIHKCFMPARYGVDILTISTIYVLSAKSNINITEMKHSVLELYIRVGCVLIGLRCNHGYRLNV